ncbi:MAG: hypothetical protein JO361_06520 [Gammaproteobacteria bacterium]|nr:hypothetical protein [Gammaproteobacteria bacterium]
MIKRAGAWAPAMLRVCLQWGALLLLVELVSGGNPARAQTDEIQVYDAEIATPGTFNLTWHNNFASSARSQPEYRGGIVPEHALNGVPEWAYGVTDWFEAGAYLPVYTRTAGGSLLFDSVKLRALFVVPNAARRSFFYGLNFELSYNTPHWEPSRLSGEMRAIAGWRLGPWDLIINPIIDTNFAGLDKSDFAPAGRAAYRISGKVAMALEEYADFGPWQHFGSRTRQSQTVFAVLDYGSSSNGIELGVGKGLTPATGATVVKLLVMRDL